MQALKKIGLVAVIGAALVGCAKDDVKPAAVAEVSPPPATEAAASAATLSSLFEAHDDGRIYLFYDQALYKDFIKTGHTAYMVARIGAGPKGETVKFALTGKDKKKREGIPSIDLFEGKLSAADKFYGETYAEGRIYVFGSYAEMENFRKVGEAPLRFTEIGAGPNGETVVYVLNSNNKKKKPVQMIEAFNRMNAG